MVKTAKLYTQLMQSTDRSISFRDFVALIEAFGFIYARTKGSHLSYKHPTCPKLMVIQPVGKDAKRYQVREFLDLVSEFDLYMEA
jgi:predicted RNA binding protein YcfA (HicA-like mRNA interferase family)